jgi:hypothetical protein
VILAALVSARFLRGPVRSVRAGVRDLRALPTVAASFSLFLFAVRAGLEANFWSYQWIVVGVILAGAGRPLRWYLDRTYPRISLAVTAGLDVAFVGLAIVTNVAFGLVAIGTVAILDAVIARERVRPSVLILALTLGSAVGFLLAIDAASFGAIAAVLIVPLALMPPQAPLEEPVRSRGAMMRGFVLTLPLAALAVGSNLSLGLRLGLQGSGLPLIAAALLGLGPLAGLLVARRWLHSWTRPIQVMAFALAAVVGLVVAFSSGTLVTALLFLTIVGSLAVGAESTLRLYAAGSGGTAAAAAAAVSWIPLFLLFFRMPPVIYSLTLLHLPEPVEALLYAPEYLIAAAAGSLAAVAFLRWRRAGRVGKGYPTAPALRDGRSP